MKTGILSQDILMVFPYFL